MQPDRNDLEVGMAVLISRAQTYSDLAAELLSEFGPERAWPVELISAYYGERFPPHRGARSRFEREPKVLAFIADRLGLIPSSEILRLGRAQFGVASFPSRSALSRLTIKLRAGAIRTAAQALP